MRKKLQSSGKYDDIIGLSRPVSKKHAPMTSYDRAAQFSPFAALTGYDGVIRETGRLTDARIELGEDGKIMLDRKLRLLRENIAKAPWAALTVFRPDERKLGGAYVRIEGRIIKIDLYKEIILLKDGTEVPIGSIYEIETDLEDVL